MIELTIIKGLTISALVLGNIIMTILTYMMIEEYLIWKGNKDE